MMMKRILSCLVLGASLFLYASQFAVSFESNIICAQLPAITGDVTRPSGSCASTLAAGSASNLNSGTLAVARGGTGVADAAGEQARLSIGMLTACITGVNFNSANTDNAIALTMPTGFTRILPFRVSISHASQTLTTATFGVFSATAAGGIAIVAAGTAIAVNTASNATSQNSQSTSTGTGVAFVAASLSPASTIQFRVGTAQGAAATGDVCLDYWPRP